MMSTLIENRKEVGMYNMTVVFLVQKKKGVESVLLPLKKKNIGAGCRNGFGGDIEDGESVTQSTIRELRDESSIEGITKHLKKVAYVKIKRLKPDGREFECNLHVLILKKWTGKFVESDEMADPQWFQIEALPIEEMIETDRLWIERVLKGETLQGEINVVEKEGLPDQISSTFEHREF